MDPTTVTGSTRSPNGASDDSEVPPSREQATSGSSGSESARTRGAAFVASVSDRTRRLVTRWSSQIARRNLLLLAARGSIKETLRDIPERMHLVARQTSLVIEFFDDFRERRYRDMPWWAVAVAATAMLYAINPADVVPNAIPILGTLDDLAVVAVAVRLLQGQLERYCQFKGYPVEEYFRS